MTKPNLKKVIIVRTNNIGDLILHLPPVRVLKQHWPQCEVSVLARAYTRPILELCPDVDKILDWDSLKTKTNDELIELFRQENYDAALVYSVGEPTTKRLCKIFKKCAIKIRIGQGRRLYKWLTLTHRLPSRKKHPSIHTAQTGLELLKPLKCTYNHALSAIPQYFCFNTPELKPAIAQQLDAKRLQVVLHPFSLGHGQEWPLENFVKLAQLLDSHTYQVIITGSASEATRLQQQAAFQDSSVLNLGGKLTLRQLAALLAHVDVVVASSTGPLHLSAALGTQTLGLFPNSSSKWPLHDFIKWRAVGRRAHSIRSARECSCKQACDCPLTLSPQRVHKLIQQWQHPEHMI